MYRIVRYAATGLLILAATPALAGAGETLKDVIVRNTSDQPIPVQGVGTQQVSGEVSVSNLPTEQQVRGSVQVSNLPPTRPLIHDSGFVSRDPTNNVIFPNDLVLTDLVLTRLGGNSTICEVAVFEQVGTVKNGIIFLYLTQDTLTEQLHLESGITNREDAWGVTLNSDCVVKVLWSGYTRP